MHYLGFLLVIGWLGVVGMPSFARAHTVAYDEHTPSVDHLEVVRSLQEHEGR